MTAAQHILDRVKEELLTSARVKEATCATCGSAIVEAVQAVASSFKSGGKLLLCGNGGSAADCQHLAAEFVTWATDGLRRPGMKAIALTTDSSILTAAGNDFGIDQIFGVQVNALGEPGDVLLAISTSGNSRNVVIAAEAAQNRGLKIVGLLGTGGGKLAGLVDIPIVIPDSDVMHIQEAHIAIGHALCRLVCELVWEQEGGPGCKTGKQGSIRRKGNQR